MKIILCADDSEPLGKNLELLIQNQLSEIQIDTMNSISDLSRKLCRPLNRISVIVIFVRCENDIRKLLTLKSLFDNIRLILVLPDRTREMMGLGLQLNPCFISFLENDLLDIISVLEKIHGGQRKQWNGRYE